MARDSVKTRRWTRIALVVSLALNLVVAGLVAGAFLHGPPRPGGHPGLSALGFEPFVSALPKQDRRALGRALAARESSFRDRRAALRREFGALLAALRAEPYEHAAVERIVTAQEAQIAASRALGRTLLLDHIGTMDAAERAAYAAELEKGLRRWRAPSRRRD